MVLVMCEVVRTLVLDVQQVIFNCLVSYFVIGNCVEHFRKQVNYVNLYSVVFYCLFGGLKIRILIYFD